MRKLIIGVVSALVANLAMANPFDPKEYDAQLYAEMIDSSELIYCNQEICNFVTDGALFDGDSRGLPDGYTITFPEGKFTTEEKQLYAEMLRDFWVTMIVMKTGDCESGQLSKKTMKALNCPGVN